MPPGSHPHVLFPGAMRGLQLVLLVFLLCWERGEHQGTGGVCTGRWGVAGGTMGSTPLLCRHHERLCGFVHVRGQSSRTRSRPPHNGSGLRGSKPSLPALPTGLVLSLQCYSCLELENTSQCQPIQCPMSGVCFNSDMTVTLGSGESPAPRGCGRAVQGALP